MTFQDAMNEIIALTPGYYRTMNYSVGIDRAIGMEIKAGLIMIPPDDKRGQRMQPVSFYGESWSEVMAKLKIYLTPVEPADVSEGPGDPEPAAAPGEANEKA